MLKDRNIYLEKLRALRDKPFIKVISGIRRCGKSVLLKLLESDLLSEGIPEDRIVKIDMDSRDLKNRIRSSDELYDEVKERMGPGRNYVLIDEVQNIDDWESALIMMYTDLDADLYVTGSNAILLSPNIGVKLVGRFVEIQVLPLSFREYMDFTERRDTNSAFPDYLRYGGFPAVALIGKEPELCRTVLEGIYSTILGLDIEQKNGVRDSAMLKDLAEYMIVNAGTVVSAKSISNYLNSNGRKNSRVTIENYLLMMERAFLLYKVRRYDIQGKVRLSTLGKYYIADLGLRNLIVNSWDDDLGRILENIIYLELLRRGYKVSIGKTRTYEIDFIADRGNERTYIQVAQTLADEKVRERELRPLRETGDEYPKMMITMDPQIIDNYNGIKNVNIIDWLLEWK